MIGGVAVAHHGYVRATKDVDIVPSSDEENLSKLWAALTEMEARPLGLDDFRPPKSCRSRSRRPGCSSTATGASVKYGRIDLLQDIAGKLESLEDYRALADAAAPAAFSFDPVASPASTT